MNAQAPSAPPSVWQRCLRWLGVPPAGYRASEQILATLGGVLGIVLVTACSSAFLSPEAVVLVVPSMGASAVLLFGVPHSPLTQPWAVLGGHVVSALIGVTCYQLVPSPLLAAALAVGLAIGGMHLLRCIHPPGGASALTAVIGGEAVHQLGYAYAVAPVALNAAIIVLVGLLFNYGFPWRRYPVSLMHYAVPVRRTGQAPAVSEAQIVRAMAQMKVVLDISPAELGQVIENVLAHDAGGQVEIKLGHSYCNDRPGPEWSVRQIIEERPSANPASDLVIYRVLKGAQKNRVESCTREEFARWAGSEVRL